MGRRMRARAELKGLTRFRRGRAEKATRKSFEKARRQPTGFHVTTRDAAPFSPSDTLTTPPSHVPHSQKTSIHAAYPAPCASGDMEAHKDPLTPVSSADDTNVHASPLKNTLFNIYAH